MGQDSKTKEQLLTELAQLQQEIVKLEVSEATRLQVEAELRARVDQQEVVADLGLRVLSGIELPTLFDETTVLVTQTLGVEFCQILELLPDQDILRLQVRLAHWSQTPNMFLQRSNIHPITPIEQIPFRPRH